MQVGQYSLRIMNATEFAAPETAEGYVSLRHGEHYTLEFVNRSGETVNVYPKIDGLPVGDFQLSPHQTARLERPAGAHQRFTFFASGSGEAQQAGEASVDRTNKGLVQVTFVPPVVTPAGPLAIRVHHLETLGPAGYVGAVCRGAGMGAGVTGMTGHSGQQFTPGVHITEDHVRAVTITLRLVVATGEASFALAPLPGRVAGNPVPPPVA